MIRAHGVHIVWLRPSFCSWSKRARRTDGQHLKFALEMHNTSIQIAMSFSVLLAVCSQGSEHCRNPRSVPGCERASHFQRSCKVYLVKLLTQN